VEKTEPLGQCTQANSICVIIPRIYLLSQRNVLINIIKTTSLAKVGGCLLKKALFLLFIAFTLQACTSIKPPYSGFLQSPTSIIKTPVGNTEVIKWEPTSPSKTTTYLIPGFPGSSLENAPLAKKLVQKGYFVHLINPPEHGRIASGNANWNYTFPQYGRALFDSIQKLKSSSVSTKYPLIIAHSAGAEMVFQWLLLEAKQGNLSHYKIVFINPWLPSISNHPIPWTKDDEDILNYSPWLVKFFGPISKDSFQKRLFVNPANKQNQDYLNAHEKMTENIGGWGTFNNRFVRLMIGTTRSQKAVLQQGKRYELPKAELVQLDKNMHSAKLSMLIINSSNDHDKIIPSNYKNALNHALKSKLPNAVTKFVSLPKGGHMLQVEQTQQVANEILR